MIDRKKIFSGVFILLLSGIAVKVLGLIFKIPIQRLIGDTGMGYFNIAYNIYAWFYIVTAAGLPVSVSVNIAGANASGKSGRCGKIFNCALFLFSSVGLLCSAVMMIFCRPLAELAGTGGAYLCIAAIAPSVFFGCVSSSVRGYYQGYGIMWPSAVSQMIEAGGKLVFGLLFAVRSLEYGNGVYTVAAHTIFGVTCGTALSALFCVTVKLFYKKAEKTGFDTEKGVLKDIILTAIPVTVSSSVMNLTGLTDVFLAPGMFREIGYTETRAAEIFGNYTTLAVPMVNLPMIFIYPITSTALPLLSAAYAENNKNRFKNTLSDAYKNVFAVCLPCSVGLSVLSGQILSLIFPKDSATLAAPMLTALAPSVILCSILAVTDTALQAERKASRPVFSMLAGAAVKFISTYLFIKYTGIGRLAIPAGTCICYLTAALLNIIFSYKKQYAVSASLFIKPAAASFVCGLSAYYSYGFFVGYFPGNISVLLSIAISALIYALSLTVSGFIRIKEITSVIRLARFKERKT